MNNHKRVVSLLLVLLMVIGTFTISAFALDDGTEGTGEGSGIEANLGEEGDVTGDEEEEEPAPVPPTAVENIKFANTEDGKVKVEKGKDFSAEALEGIKFVAVDNKSAAVVEAETENLAEAVEVEGLAKDQLYAVYGTKTDADDVLLGYYANVTLVAEGFNDAVDVEWTALKVPADFKVSYSLYNGDNAQLLDKSEETSYHDATASSMDADYSYYAVVRVVSDENKEYVVGETEKSVACLAEQPDVPQNLTMRVYKAAQYTDAPVVSADAVELTWDAVEGADGYRVYAVKADGTKAFKDTEKTTFMYDGLDNDSDYTFYVVSIKKAERANGKKESDPSEVTESTHIKYNDADECHAIWYNGKMKYKSKAFATSSSKKVVKYLPKNAPVKVLSRNSARSKVLYNGTVYWVGRSKCKYTSSIYDSSRDWTTKAKEAYVNNNSSSTKYLIFISQYTQRVNVYEGKKGAWKLIRTGLCATGVLSNKTPMGTFKTYKKEKGWYWKNRWCGPIVRFASKNSFHSLPMRYSGAIIDPTLGKPMSHGCIRLETPYIKYIHSLPLKTTVMSY